MAYKFIKTKDSNNEFDISDVVIEIESNELTIDDLLKEFQCFLMACGFGFRENEELMIRSQ